MAHLFSHKLLQETLKNVTIPEMEEKIAVLQSWVNAINNKSIYKKTESECEQAFNLDIFHKVLGYTFYPTEQFTLEAKGGNEISGQKADATLGYFNASAIEKNVSLVQVAVEIKDANTSLTKSQRREGNLSPIQQGFKYKPQYNNCKWVIVTNFVEIRLFKDTQLDYEVWNLIDLVNPENDYQQFKLFWYLLNAKHLISPIGIASVTEKLLSAVRIQSEQITKKFYHEYKSLRLQLINDIRKNNTDVSMDVVIQKAQKVIDRIVFIHFCEDFGLLPEGKLAEVIQYSQSLVGVSIWQILIGFFEAVNSGSGKLGIPNGYNGGLFHEDKQLNNLKIGDDICQKFVDLGKYDFEEDLSVNILGHIFEQSISDLEDLRIDMLGTELETGELGESTKSNKRKKDGIFYTPEYIVDYIVKNSLGKYLEEQFETIEKKHLKNAKQMKDKTYDVKQQAIYREYQKVLSEVKVLDPACGSGAFLVKVFDYLLEENVRVMEVLSAGDTGLIDSYVLAKDILTHNIYGVDLNAESVEITKLSLWLKTAEKGKKLADLDNNIKCGNSLIDDPAVAGDKAFDWNKQFSDIMNKGGFDVIVGNPPYITFALGKKQEFEDIDIKYYKNRFPLSSAYKVNSYLIFIEKSLELISKTGLVSFIVPNTIYTNYFYSKFREYLIDNFSIHSLFNLEYEVFDDADTGGSSIFVIGKSKIKNTTLLSSKSENETLNPYLFLINQNEFKNIPDNKFLFSNSLISLWNKSFEGSISLANNNFQFYNGIKTGDNKGFLSSKKLDDRYKPIIRGRDFYKYTPLVSEVYVLFDPEKLWSNANEKMYLVEEKIIFRQTSDHLVVTYDNNKNFTMDTTHLLFDKQGKFNHRYLLSVLNSKLLNFLYQIIVPEVGKTFSEVKVVNLKSLPIKEINLDIQQPFIEKADQMLTMNKQLHEKINFTLRFFQSKFAIEKFSNKLKKFRELDFAGFLKELKVKKLPLDTEAELMRYFEKEKAEILTLKAQIDAVDTEIDDMVFDLYGLTEEEKRVVLESNNIGG